MTLLSKVMSGMTCPQCGGTELRILTPGSYECMSPVLVGMLPNAHGPGMHQPAHRLCGHLFQIGAGPSGETCPCGRFAIGRCQGCDRALCGMHGARTSRFLCSDCIERERAASREREAEARAQAATRRAGDSHAATALVQRSDDPSAIVEVLTAHEDLVPVEAMRCAWQRFAEAGLFTASEDMVTVEGRATAGGYVLSRGTYTTQFGKWTETSREPALRARGAGRQVIPANGEQSECCIEGFDVWFDRSGQLWSDGRGRGPAVLSIKERRETARVVVPTGAPFRPQRRKSNFLGWEMQVPGAQHAWPYHPGAIEYARALVAVLSRPARH